LSQYETSPVNVITTTTAEIYSFQNDFLFELGILENKQIMDELRTSWSESNPSVEEVTKRYIEKYQWEEKKKSMAILKH
jgi:hypothetical protein